MDDIKCSFEFRDHLNEMKEFLTSELYKWSSKKSSTNDHAIKKEGGDKRPGH